MATPPYAAEVELIWILVMRAPASIATVPAANAQATCKARALRRWMVLILFSRQGWACEGVACANRGRAAETNRGRRIALARAAARRCWRSREHLYCRPANLGL